MAANTTRLGAWRTLAVLLCLASLSAAGGSPLIDAVKQQDKAAVRALLAQRVDVNAPEPDGATALHWAVHRDDLETAGLLIRAGARVDAANDYGVTPLTLACTNGNVAMVEAILKAGANPNTAVPSTGETPLMTAARTGKVDVVTALIKGGANVQATEPWQRQTPLMWAVAARHADVARILIEHGADVQARSKDGFTPLMFAAREGDLDSARILVAAGANANDVAADGSSVLLVATVRDQTPVALFLLELGADPNAHGTGYTALHWASGSWDSQLPAKVGMIGKNETLVKALLAHGADPNARVEQSPRDHVSQRLFRFGDGGGQFGFGQARLKLEGATPFLLAAAAGEAGIMRILADAGADPLLKTTENTTPLMVAAGFGRNMEESRVTTSSSLEAVKLALTLGNDVNAANGGGDTALHGAGPTGMNAVIQYLIEKGADVTAKNTRAQTPFAVARNADKTTLDLLRPPTADKK